MIGKTGLGAIMTLGMLAAPLPAFAVSVLTHTWNTCEGGADLKCAHGYVESSRTPSGSAVGTVGASGSKITFDAREDGTDLIVGAYQTSSDVGGGPLLPTRLSIWDGGLGAGGEGSSPNHAVDNMGYDEYLLLDSRDKNTTWSSFRIGWSSNNSGSGRPEITVRVGNAAADLLALSSIDWGASGPTSGWANRSLTDVAVNEAINIGFTGQYLLIGATTETRTGNSCSGYGRSRVCSTTTSDAGNDAFKLLQVVGTREEEVGRPAGEVPEPATLGLIGLGLLGLGFSRRCKTVA